MASKLAIKLGGRCNLACAHCHCMPSSYKFNPEIIDWINSRNFDLIVFEGGEPLIYLDQIKNIVSKITKPTQYKIVTNGTLLTDSDVEWLNANDFLVIVSFDGSEGQRDMIAEPKWNIASKLKNLGLNVCCYHGNMDFGVIANQIDELRAKWKISPNLPGALHHITFPHQTAYAPNSDMTEQDVCDYIAQSKLQLDFCIQRLLDGVPLNNLWLLDQAIKRWLLPKAYEGFACFNNDNLHITLDGRFLLCPYDHSYVGDIWKGIDWERVFSYEPVRCKSCEIRDVCKNVCIANVTTNECQIAKDMNKYLKSRIRVNH